MLAIREDPDVLWSAAQTDFGLVDMHERTLKTVTDDGILGGGVVFVELPENVDIKLASYLASFACNT
jgi:hypothetical protein